MPGDANRLVAGDVRSNDVPLPRAPYILEGSTLRRRANFRHLLLGIVFIVIDDTHGSRPGAPASWWSVGCSRGLLAIARRHFAAAGLGVAAAGAAAVEAAVCPRYSAEVLAIDQQASKTRRPDCTFKLRAVGYPKAVSAEASRARNLALAVRTQTNMSQIISKTP
eukprot:6201193-Pleurochrysis_carterae.AAC.4